MAFLMHPQPCAKFGRALKLSAYRGRPEAEAALPNGAFDPYRKCGGSLLTALCWHLQRPTASVERAPYHKARLIQINAALIRANFHAGGCDEFMKVHAIQAGQIEGRGHGPRRRLQPVSGVSRKPIRLIWRNALSA